MTLAQVLEDGRAAAGAKGRPMSFREVRDRMLAEIGPYTPTQETLRQMHGDAFDRRPDPIVVGALARIYGIDLSAIEDAAPEVVTTLRSVSSWCAPWDLNPEPADYGSPALAAA